MNSGATANAERKPKLPNTVDMGRSAYKLYSTIIHIYCYGIVLMCHNG
jgi:hypothetical protein